MKKLIVSAVLLSVSLWAADFWQSKKFMEWNEKDVQKMLDNSPWAKQVTVALGDFASPGGRGGGKKGGNGRSGMGEITSNPQAPGAMEDSGRGGGHGGRSDDDMATGITPTAQLTVRWQSATPIKQALVRARYGAEATTSPEAKKILEQVEPNYVIVVSGLTREALRGDTDSIKKKILAESSLAVKGKDSIKPIDFMLQRSAKGVDAYFAFPRSAALSVDDKEVEFLSKFHSMIIKQRFVLKSMVIDGKLEL